MRPEYRSRLLHRPDREDALVRTDVFIHNLDPFTLEALRRAMMQGLMPSGLDFTGDAVILRFSRTRAPSLADRTATPN